MTLDYEITHEDGVVVINARGKLDFLALDRMWRDIATACVDYDCARILGIANFEKPTQEDAYDHASVLSYAGLPDDCRIAWVEQNPNAQELASLAAAVVRHRGVAAGRTFDDISAAKRWLVADSV